MAWKNPSGSIGYIAGATFKCRRKKTERKSTQITVINNSNSFPVYAEQYIGHFIFSHFVTSVIVVKKRRFRKVE